LQRPASQRRHAVPTDLPSNLNLALLLTAAGATAGAALVTGVVQLLKSVWPGQGLSGKGQLRLAFFLAAVLTLMAYASGVQGGQITVSLPTVFALFLAWYAIARLSKTIYDDATHQPGSLAAE
jgi:hypothetical protein